jgi:hypothetical protein
MANPLELSGDVVAGATALAGLILVYLGGVSSEYAGFDKQAQATVRYRLQVKAWLAVIGLVLSILSAGLALIGKWSGIECIVSVAILLLLISLLWGSWIAISIAREIK